MKLCGFKKSVSSQRGLTIIEMLAYVILCAGFLAMAYRTVTVSSRGIMALQDNAYDIIRVTKAGERWRQDIREAISPPVEQSQQLDSPPRVEQMTNDDGIEGVPETLPLILEAKAEKIQITYLKIEKSEKTIWYAFRQGKVYRKDSLAPESWELVLKNVAASNMVSESRGEASVWRWEIELKTTRKDILTRPLFSFISVPIKAQKP
tara:strand:- start:140 stop:757 length:618 start_codon:yes stop_codon:yes gene_type:complete